MKSTDVLGITPEKATKSKAELPALTPNTTERLHNLMSDYIATGGKGTTENEDEDDAFIKWRGTHTPDSTSHGKYTALHGIGQ